jgi:hypothetical protein
LDAAPQSRPLRDIGPGTGRMLSAYIAEVGEPLVTLIDRS